MSPTFSLLNTTTTAPLFVNSCLLLPGQKNMVVTMYSLYTPTWLQCYIINSPELLQLLTAHSQLLSPTYSTLHKYEHMPPYYYLWTTQIFRGNYSSHNVLIIAHCLVVSCWSLIYTIVMCLVVHQFSVHNLAKCVPVYRKPNYKHSQQFHAVFLSGVMWTQMY